VHWSGPEKPSVADITIFRNNVQPLLDAAGECIEVGKGGGRENATKTPNTAKSGLGRKQKSRARANQDNSFSNLKAFEAFKKPWLHSHIKHQRAFGAVMVLLQLGLENGTVGQWAVGYTNEYFQLYDRLNLKQC
jgi:hypothetical protein